MKATGSYFLPAGERTVSVSNKIEGIPNKHWHTVVLNDWINELKDGTVGKVHT